MNTILRTLVVLLAFALVLPRAAQAQTFTYQNVQWGEPRARVLSAFQRLGYDLSDEEDGRLYFWAEGEPGAIAILNPERRLVAVMIMNEGSARQARMLYNALTDSVRGRVGEPTLETDSTHYWDAGTSTLTVVLAPPTENSTQSAVNVLFSGPGWEAVRDRRPNGPSAGAGGGFAPIDETRWLVAFQGAERRVSIDRTRVTAMGNDVYRVWERWEAAEPVQGSDGGWYDATLTRVDYDCRNLRTRMVEMTTYNGGRVVDTVEIAPARQTWDSAVPESVGETTLRTACPVLRTLR